MIVAFTNDSQRLADRVSKRYASKFQRVVSPARLEAFRQSGAPVRILHMTRYTNLDGSTPEFDPVGPAIFRSIRASRINGTPPNVFEGAIIVVDTNRVRGVSYQQLSAYIALVSLAMVDPEADTGEVDSILSLFADRDAGKTLPHDATNWDIAYLQGLYTGTNAIIANQKNAGIAVRMKYELDRVSPPIDDEERTRARRSSSAGSRIRR